MFSTVIARDSKYGIAKDGKIPWYSKEDLLHFKSLTEGNIVIMGRKTFETLKNPLKNRLNIVLSRKIKKESNNPDNVMYFSDPWICAKYCIEQRLEGYPHQSPGRVCKANHLLIDFSQKSV